MSISLRNFKTDFSSFLGEATRKIVKIVLQDAILECSTALLSQHSSVLAKLAREDEEIFLDNYIHARACLGVLYGGSLSLTIGNAEEVLKFSIQFDVEDMLDQTVAWMDKTVDETNILQFMKICCSMVSFSKFIGRELDCDRISWPCIKYIVYLPSRPLLSGFLIVPPTDDIQAGSSSTDNNDQASSSFMENTQAVPTTNTAVIISKVLSENSPAILCIVLMRSQFINHLLPTITSCVNKENVEVIVTSFDKSKAKVFERLAGCDKGELTALFDTLAGFNLPLETSKMLHNISSTALVYCTMAKMSNIDTDTMLKSSKTMSEQEISIVCRMLVNTKEEQFYRLETFMSWVGSKKPAHYTVLELWNGMSVSALTVAYLNHAVAVLSQLGYQVGFKSAPEGMDVPLESHRISSFIGLRFDIRNNKKTSLEMNVNCPSHVLGRSDWDRKKKIRRQYKCQECESSIVFQCSTRSVTPGLIKPTLTCLPKSDGDGDGNRINTEILVYGRTRCNKQIPFYTDTHDAIINMIEFENENILASI